MSDATSSVRLKIDAAKRAGRQLAAATGPHRRTVLIAMADMLASRDARARLLETNGLDVADAEQAWAAGTLSRALVDRLVLTEAKLDALIDGLHQLASQDDLIGRVTLHRELDEGLELRRVTCPLGLLGVVFEARPDAVPQIAGLAIRTGNAVVLKGGREAQRSNAALVELLHRAVQDQGFDPAIIALLEGRGEVDEVLRLDRDIDLLIARGSSAFVHHVQANTRIPVLAHAEGLCHLFLHRSAAPAMAAELAVDSKCTYPSACNAIETLLWEPGAEAALDAAIAALAARNVELRGCPDTRARHASLGEATEEDWSTEYGELVLAIRRVDDAKAALDHIERYGSKHTEAIVAEDPVAAAEFLAQVDSAGVFHNASTRFADGYRFGLGAEVGISTSKLHARGPVGVDGLVTYRWLLEGRGHRSADYGPGKARFTHHDL